MKSYFRRLRGLALRRSELNEKLEHRPPVKLDDLVQAAQDVQILRSYYDTLLSAAAATANCAYEFSEALHEMGTCFVEKTTLNDDKDIGHASLMLGKAQFELNKHIDNYRSHIIQTITTPSEHMLRELQILEDMKEQCDVKRDLYKFMITVSQQKGRARKLNGDTFTPQQLQAAREDYEEEANLFVFRLKSLKQGQSRSIFMQVARHHAAQLNLFRKGFKSLELIEPRVKLMAERRQIDYHFDDVVDDGMGCEGDESSYYNSSSADELSFDNEPKELSDDSLSMRRDSTTVENKARIQSERLHHNQRSSPVSQSAPIFTNRGINISEKIKNIPPPSTRKGHTYVLPTPMNVKNSSLPSSQLKNGTAPIQHSYSPHLHEVPNFGENRSQSPLQTTFEGQNLYFSPMKIPAMSSDTLFSNQFTSPSSFEAKVVRRYAFSGPITGKPKPAKPFFNSNPKISELHELPKPPNFTAQPAILPVSLAASPLPVPPAVLRCFSIPYRGQRTPLGSLNFAA